MNDSFLEDLDLVPKDKNAQNTTQPSRYITTRKVLTPPVSNRSKNETLESKHDRIISSSSINVSRSKLTRRSGSQEPRKVSATEGKPLSSTPKSERKNQDNENIKPAENHMKVDEPKVKSHDIRQINKVSDAKSVKDKKRTSGSLEGTSKSNDASCKENTRPFTDSLSSRESSSQVDLRKNMNRRTSDGSRKSDILDKTDPIMLLSAIKDLVSRYTEQETVKVLRAMQNLHVNSQANLIKHLMLQTSDIVNELSIHKNSGSVKNLLEENEKMREDIFLLKTINEVLQKKVDEMVLLKEENISLKLKLKELQQ